MSADVFAPGQAAIVTVRGEERTALRDSNGGWLIGDLEDLRIVYDFDNLITAVRPLYVLDVANERKVSALHKALAENGSVRDAVESLLARPAEPKLPGAIVRCVDSTVRVRTDEEPEKPWKVVPPSEGPDQVAPWSAFSAVEVLFLGVPA